MNEKRIGEIVRRVYKKAKEACASEAKNALTKHVEENVFEEYRINISYKTVERAFDKYIEGKKVGSPLAESVDLFCKYLGFKDYKDYILKRKRKWILIVMVIIAFGAILFVPSILKNEFSDGFNSQNPSVSSKECMTWADSLYVLVSCVTKPYSKYGTRVEPLDQMKLDNFKKIRVHAAYSFFADDGKPLVWYYKTKEDEIECFTAPGFHPTNGETLKKITPYIIDKYVPLYSN